MSVNREIRMKSKPKQSFVSAGTLTRFPYQSINKVHAKQTEQLKWNLFWDGKRAINHITETHRVLVLRVVIQRVVIVLVVELVVIKRALIGHCYKFYMKLRLFKANSKTPFGKVLFWFCWSRRCYKREWGREYLKNPRLWEGKTFFGVTMRTRRAEWLSARFIETLKVIELAIQTISRKYSARWLLDLRSTGSHCYVSTQPRNA